MRNSRVGYITGTTRPWPTLGSQIRRWSSPLGFVRRPDAILPGLPHSHKGWFSSGSFPQLPGSEPAKLRRGSEHELPGFLPAFGQGGLSLTFLAFPEAPSLLGGAAGQAEVPLGLQGGGKSLAWLLTSFAARGGWFCLVLLGLLFGFVWFGFGWLIDRLVGLIGCLVGWLAGWRA